jgi:SAM-dependent methyltransferase
MIDFGASAADYARFRQGHDASFFDRLASHGVGLPGQHIVDLGTGTGLFARALAERGCHVTGIDPSEPMLVQAKKLDDGRSIGHLEYRRAAAESTGLSSATYDAVTASTCWHWFDRAAAAAEAFRLLVPGGKLAISALDWLLLPGNVIEATLDLIAKNQPAAPAGQRTFIYPEWTSDLVAMGCRAWDVFAYTTTLTYSHEAWCGRVRASADIANLEGDKLAHFTAELRDMLLRRFPSDPMQIDHKVFCLVASS